MVKSYLFKLNNIRIAMQASDVHSGESPPPPRDGQYVLAISGDKI